MPKRHIVRHRRGEQTGLALGFGDAARLRSGDMESPHDSGLAGMKGAANVAA
jgi:hypothetical protein